MYYKSRRTTLKSIIKSKMFGIYALILLVFIIGIIFLINSMKADSQSSNEGTTTSAFAEENSSDTNTSTTTQVEPTTDGQQTILKYKITINTALNYVQIYTLDENNEYKKPYKTMLCSVSKSTATGLTKLDSRYIWRPLDNGEFAQYACKSDTGIQLQSCPYTMMEHNKLNTKVFNKLGTEIKATNLVYLYVADAKWIYDNCPNGTQIEVIYNEIKPYYITIPEHKQIPDLVPWEPTDDAIGNCYLENGIGRIEGVPDTLDLPLGSYFGYTVGVKAYDALDNDVSKQLVVRGRVYTDKVGSYVITYILIDKNCEYIIKESIINIVATENEED